MNQQENDQNRLSYQGDMSDGSSVYHMTLAGRVVFRVKANKDEAGMPIYIHFPENQPNALLMDWSKTACRAFPVKDGSRISAISMKEAVYGNLPFLLADLLYGPVQS